MARLIQPPRKFTPPEWVISNQRKYGEAESERAAAERLIDESKRLVEETEKSVGRAEKDVDRKYEQHLDELNFWKDEIDKKLADLKLETDALKDYKGRIEAAMTALKEPLHIAEQCLVNRQNRKAIDLVHDEPERELLKEVQVLQGVLSLLARTMEKVDDELMSNRKFIYRLERDLKEKADAIVIDEAGSELRAHTPGLRFSGQPVTVDGRAIAPDEWKRTADATVKGAESQRQNSENLRATVEAILGATCDDARNQKSATDLALQKRVEETKDAKTKLEDQLARVNNQVIEMEDNVDMLRKAHAEKEGPLKLAHSRLLARDERPDSERTKDKLQHRLAQQVHQLEGGLDKMALRLAQSEHSLRGLVQKQLDLQEDIEVKANTIYIDETICMGMRMSINIQPY